MGNTAEDSNGRCRRALTAAFPGRGPVGGEVTGPRLSCPATDYAGLDFGDLKAGSRNGQFTSPCLPVGYASSSLSRSVNSNSAACGLVPRPSTRSWSAPLAQAHHSSALRTAESISRGPQATSLSCQLDGFAAIASRQHSVSPFAAMAQSRTDVRLREPSPRRARGTDRPQALAAVHRPRFVGGEVTPPRLSCPKAQYPALQPLRWRSRLSSSNHLSEAALARFLATGPAAQAIHDQDPPMAAAVAR